MPRRKKSLSTPRLIKASPKPDPRLERILAEEELLADLSYLYGSDKRPRAKPNRRHKNRA